MSQKVPDSWKSSTLQEVCIGKGEYGANVAKGRFSPSFPRYIRITDIGQDGRLIPTSLVSISPTDAADYMLQDGDIVFARSGATVGKTYQYSIADGACAYAGYLIRFRPNRHLVSPSYLRYCVSSASYWRWVGKSQRAQAQPNINAQEFASFPILLPPLPEQRRIAEILSSVDEAVAATQAVIDQTRTVKQVVMNRLLTKGIGHSRFKQTEIGEIPEGWEVLPLSDIVRSLDAGVSVNSEGRRKKSDEIGILKTSSVSYGEFDPEQHKTVLVDEMSRVRVPVKGDRIIISRMNTPTLVGASAYVQMDYPELFVPDRLWQLDVNDREQINVRWLSHLLSWGQTRERISGLAAGTSGSMKNISKQRFLEMLIALPPIEEQRVQSTIITEIDCAGSNGLRSLGSAERIKSALMSDLLTGRKRVPLPGGTAAAV